MKYEGEIHHAVPLYLGGSYKLMNLLAVKGKAREDVAVSAHAKLHRLIESGMDENIGVYVKDYQTNKYTPVSLDNLKSEELRSKLSNADVGLNLVIGTLFNSGDISYRETEVKIPAL